jgi:hypothetical protein
LEQRCGVTDSSVDDKNLPLRLLLNQLLRLLLNQRPSRLPLMRVLSWTPPLRRLPRRVSLWRERLRPLLSQPHNRLLSPKLPSQPQSPLLRLTMQRRTSQSFWATPHMSALLRWLRMR